MSQEQAEVYKNKGNELFKGIQKKIKFYILCFLENKFAEAADEYSKAIEIAPSAVYYSNRAFCHIRLESYGDALADADAAIKLDEHYAKVLFFLYFNSYNYHGRPIIAEQRRTWH